MAIENTELVDEIITDLTTELSAVDERFNASLLTIKVNQAYREVKTARSYPSSYTSDMISADIEKFYAQIRNVALYDYNTIGAEFQEMSQESSETRQWIDRKKLFYGIIPIAKC